MTNKAARSFRLDERIAELLRRLADRGRRSTATSELEEAILDRAEKLKLITPEERKDYE